MAKTVDPGAPENLYPENAFKAALLKRTRAQRIPFRPGDRLLQQRPDTFAQTFSVILIFRLQNGGGPYVPVGG
jgi:hypothetical protein